MYHVDVVCPLDVGVDKLENLLLDGPQTANLGRLGCNVAFPLDSLVNETTRGTVHVEHIQVNSANLRVKVAANGGTSRDIGLHNISDDLYCLTILQSAGIVVRLLDDGIPLVKVSITVCMRYTTDLQLGLAMPSTPESIFPGRFFALGH